jgi:hypothetical protein
MNSRHTAALALVGWYLMLPPAGTEGKLPERERSAICLVSGGRFS